MLTPLTNCISTAITRCPAALTSAGSSVGHYLAASASLRTRALPALAKSRPVRA
jgi:hypothetical protein